MTKYLENVKKKLQNNEIETSENGKYFRISLDTNLDFLNFVDETTIFLIKKLRKKWEIS